MKFLLQHPLTKWRNLVINPNLVIRKNAVSFSQEFYEIETRIDFLRTFTEKNKGREQELKKITDAIKRLKPKTTEKKTKKNEQIMKDLNSYVSRQKNILEEQKKSIQDYTIYTKDIKKKIEQIIKIGFELTIGIMTLLHRERVDADELIHKIRKLKDEHGGRVEQYKEHSIKFLNEIKKEIKRIAEEMYRTYQYQGRSVYNPVAAISEMSPQTTRIKCRRLRQATIEVDNYESLVQNQIKNIKIGQIPHLVNDSWMPQLRTIREMAEKQTRVLTHRIHKLIHHINENEAKSLKKDFKSTLRKITRQSLWLANSIDIKEYRAKKVKLKITQAKKPENVLEMQKKIEKKAA